MGSNWTGEYCINRTRPIRSHKGPGDRLNEMGEACCEQFAADEAQTTVEIPCWHLTRVYGTSETAQHMLTLFRNRANCYDEAGYGGIQRRLRPGLPVRNSG